MTLFYPDVSHFQAGLSLAGAPVVAAKASEGTTFRDQAYAGFRAQAAALGALFIPYHYLHSTSPAAQADWCFSIAGRDGPLMLDVESGSGTVATVLGFVDRYRALGGAVRLVYLPHWYWAQIGSPDLRPLAAAGLALVSSQYTAYSDSGPGWAPYGGVTPAIWQYTDAHPFNGQHVDFNAYRGSLAQLRSLITGGSMALTQADFDAFAKEALREGSALHNALRAVPWQYVGGGIPANMSTLGVLNNTYEAAVAAPVDANALAAALAGTPGFVEALAAALPDVPTAGQIADELAKRLGNG